MTDPKRPAAVLFDLDGTLIDTKDLYMEAYRVAVDPYVRPDMTREDIMALRPTSEVAFLRAVVHESDFEAVLADFYGAYERLHTERFGGVFAGIPEVLDRIRGHGLPLGLVTGKSRRSWEITRAAMAELGPFDALVFDDDVRAPKPDPHGLELAVETLRVEPGRAAYVGDTRSDMEAASTAGLRPVAALWARDPESRDEHVRRVEAEGATVAHRPDELLRILAL
ncbi:MAG: HAD-IA family hydrolase [Longimicrobiales bacterium]|nr:HAD-IA family hydrolase [Longimicrobiales bacterium]